MLTTMAHILMNRNIVNAGNNYQTTITDASVVIIQLTSYLTVGTLGFRIQKGRDMGLVFLEIITVLSNISFVVPQDSSGKCLMQ